uniref:Uncharacterized protein n=1 Tax=Anser cygnoides TaxID=8845 RepID=A0A8B9ETU6_ANSCY
MQDPPGAVQDPPGGMQDPPGAMQDPPGAMQDPPGAMQDPPGGVQDPPGAMQDPPGAVQDPPGGMQDPPGAMQDPPGAMQDLLCPAARRQRGLCCPPAPLAAANGVWVAFRDKGPPATRASTPSDFSFAPRAAAKCPVSPLSSSKTPIFVISPQAVVMVL